MIIIRLGGIISQYQMIYSFQFVAFYISSFTISYARYAPTEPAALADDCTLCRNTLFLEYGTEGFERMLKVYKKVIHDKVERAPFFVTIATMADHQTHSYFHATEQLNEDAPFIEPDHSLSPRGVMCMDFLHASEN